MNTENNRLRRNSIGFDSGASAIIRDEQIRASRTGKSRDCYHFARGARLYCIGIIKTFDFFLGPRPAQKTKFRPVFVTRPCPRLGSVCVRDR